MVWMDAYNQLVSEAAVFTVGTLLNDSNDVVRLIKYHANKDPKVVSAILNITAVRNANSFSHLTKRAKADSLKDIMRTPILMSAFILRAGKDGNAIKALLERLTIDHIQAGPNLQYSISKMLNDDDLLHQLTIQLCYNKKALERIMTCGAVRCDSSFSFMADHEQVSLIDGILSDASALETFIGRLEHKPDAVAQLLQSQPMKDANSLVHSSHERIASSVQQDVHVKSIPESNHRNSQKKTAATFLDMTLEAPSTLKQSFSYDTADKPSGTNEYNLSPETSPVLLVDSTSGGLGTGPTATPTTLLPGRETPVAPITSSSSSQSPPPPQEYSYPRNGSRRAKEEAIQSMLNDDESVEIFVKGLATEKRQDFLTTIVNEALMGLMNLRRMEEEGTDDESLASEETEEMTAHENANLDDKADLTIRETGTESRKGPKTVYCL